MAFDPTLPLPGANVQSAVLRAQFNGLSEKIDASLPLSVVVDGVTALPAGSPPTVDLSIVGNVLHFTFGIPAGPTGAPGADGTNGTDGAPGQTGPPGEVTSGTLAASIATTAMNPANVDTLTISNPDADLQAIVAAHNELLAAIKRV